MARKKGANRPPGGFAGVPNIVLKHPDFRGLSTSAKVILLFLAHQYKGKNNGDLSASHSLVKHWGITSKATIRRAVTELVDANLIIRTREAQFLNPGGKCALYALTWESIDDCNGKLEVGPTNTPVRKISMEHLK